MELGDGARHRRVLVVDDAADNRLLVVRALTREGFTVEEAVDGPSALAAVADSAPDLIVLDVTMPGMSGIEVLTQLRRTSSTPVIFLTGRGEEVDRVVGLELGADDYMVKPFSVSELAARVRSVLRRCSAPPPRRLDFGPLEIRPTERTVVLNRELVELTPREFDLLVMLARSPRQVFSRAQLLESVWGSREGWQDPATVTEHVRRLRRKLEADPDRPRWVVTDRGVGYHFEP